MNNIMMRQCFMNRWEGDYVYHITSWIPEKFAKVGKYVKLKDNGEWKDGWKIISVGDTRKSYGEVLDRGQDYKRTREASDI